MLIMDSPLRECHLMADGDRPFLFLATELLLLQAALHGSFIHVF